MKPARALEFLALLAGGLIGSASPAPAQTTPATSRVNYRLPSGTRMVGSLLRNFCEKTLRIGDTVSAVVGPEQLTVRKSERWPKEVVLLLRRTVSMGPADPRVTFDIVSAKANGRVTTNARGIVVVDVESAVPDPADADRRCYDHGAVFGQLARELRFR